jgi:hypothetical protein
MVAPFQGRRASQAEKLWATAMEAREVADALAAKAVEVVSCP